MRAAMRLSLQCIFLALSPEFYRTWSDQPLCEQDLANTNVFTAEGRLGEFQPVG